MKKLFLVLALLILMSQGAFAVCNPDLDKFDTKGWCIDQYGVMTPKTIATDSQQISSQGGSQDPVIVFTGAYSTYDTLSVQNSGSDIVDFGAGTTTVAGQGGEYILPTAAAGLVYSFAVGSANTITIDTLITTDTIYSALATPAGNGIKNTSKSTADSVTIVGVAAGKWVIKSQFGTWASTGANRVH